MKTIKTERSISNPLQVLVAFFTTVLLTSCMGDIKEKLDEAAEGASNATTLVKEVQGLEGKLEKFKDATPLTNDQLKQWLPKSLGDLDRSGFKIGQAGIYKVNSLEGTFKEVDGKRKFNVLVIDGAGPTGSIIAAGYGMFGNMEMEVEDEYKHQQTATVYGITAQQTYKKKTNDTQLMFAFKERFLVTVNSSNMNPKETWEMTQKLGLDQLVVLAE